MDTLHTQRLILRPLARSDARDLFGARCDTEVMEFWDALPDATCSETIAIVDLLLAEVLSGAAKYWTILLHSDESFVGICDLSEIRSGESADLGFMFASRVLGNGLREGGRQLSFAVREIFRLEACHFSAAAARCAALVA
jgi:RimJ/RimL family protein N-acetyltransferase